MTRAGIGLCKEANGTDTQSFHRASLPSWVAQLPLAQVRVLHLYPQISMAVGILDSLAIFNLAI